MVVDEALSISSAASIKLEINCLYFSNMLLTSENKVAAECLAGTGLVPAPVIIPFLHFTISRE